MSSLRIGSLELRSPVVLAPMAGITNVAFRTLCRELETERAGSTSGLYVCEMVTARALVERQPATLHMTTFGPTETPRSLQLYTVDPDTTYAAAKMIVDENMADHIDMNFGCPVPKVTRKGGGAALPYKRTLFGRIVAAAVEGDRGHRHPGDRQVPRRHRRRAPHASRRRPDRRRRGRRRGRTARAYRLAAVLRHRRLERDRPAQGARHGRARPRQRRHLRRRGRGPHDGRRPGATASSSGADASAGHGCSRS